MYGCINIPRATIGVSGDLYPMMQDLCLDTIWKRYLLFKSQRLLRHNIFWIDIKLGLPQRSSGWLTFTHSSVSKEKLILFKPFKRLKTVYLYYTFVYFTTWQQMCKINNARQLTKVKTLKITVVMDYRLYKNHKSRHIYLTLMLMFEKLCMP